MASQKFSVLEKASFAIKWHKKFGDFRNLICLDIGDIIKLREWQCFSLSSDNLPPCLVKFMSKRNLLQITFNLQMTRDNCLIFFYYYFSLCYLRPWLTSSWIRSVTSSLVWRTCLPFCREKNVFYCLHLINICSTKFLINNDL